MAEGKVGVAPREGFEPPSPRDSGFRIHRNTGLCDLGSKPATCDLVISLTSLLGLMRITVNYEDGGPSIVESDEPRIAEVLERLDIAPSTVLCRTGVKPSSRTPSDSHRGYRNRTDSRIKRWLSPHEVIVPGP